MVEVVKDTLFRDKGRLNKLNKTGMIFTKFLNMLFQSFLKYKMFELQLANLKDLV